MFYLIFKAKFKSIFIIFSFKSGGYLLVRDHKHEKNLALNCFFKSSAKLDLNDYKTSPVDGKKSVAIPGELKCLQIVYHKYARYFNNHFK